MPTPGQLDLVTDAAFFSETTAAQRKTLLAAALGWALDAFDVMLYVLVLAYITRELHMSKATAGFLATLTLLASGIGGLLFGFIADRFGRRTALMLSILTYSVCSFASGLARSIPVLATFRFILGLGMGGEWNTGATLVAETWPAKLRARAIAIVQSSWALGFAAAALVSGIVLHFLNWRAVFFVGIAPALVVLWIRRSVPESELWKEGQLQPATAAQPSARFSDILKPPYLGRTITLLLMNLFGLFAWWGVFSWMPPYLSLPVSEGGRGFGLMDTTKFLVTLNLLGMFPGYLSFGFAADRFGRRNAFVLYTACAALLVPLYAMARAPFAIMVLGILVAFFGTGFFSGSALIGSEMFPTRVRARALGFTYNGARALSSISPFVIGYAARWRGLSGAFYFCAGSFLLASLVATQLPETKGKVLD
jgi:MFS family permease